MSIELNLGTLNGHAVGRILKEAVRRATVSIRNERIIFETHAKKSHGGTMDDVFTSADTKAQEIYTRTFQECFPNCGVIGEENSLNIMPRNGCTAYFTVDPLDGTKAYIRRQSHGVGTMVALVDGGEAISAWIGDINTEEIYGYRPGSDQVWRITHMDTVELLKHEPVIGLNSAHVMLRDPLDQYSIATQNLVAKCKSYEIIGSSIGIWMARLWKGGVSAVFMNKGYETPWDSIPVIGISQKLGYVFLKEVNGSWLGYKPELSRNIYRREHDILVIHRDDLKLFLKRK